MACPEPRRAGPDVSSVSIRVLFDPINVGIGNFPPEVVARSPLFQVLFQKN